MPLTKVQVSDLPLQAIYRKVEGDFSLEYLQVVETVINVSTYLRNSAETLERTIEHVLSCLSDIGKPIDPAGTSASLGVSAENVVREAITALRGLDSALGESGIPTDDAEAMSGGNKEAIMALQRLHDSMVDLRWAIAEHDADFEKPEGKTFDNVQELVAELKSV